MPYYVYFMSNRPNGTIYVGVTNDLVRRVYEHRTNAVPGFTSRYNLHRLVYFEFHQTAIAAIQREKTIKRWVRQWKINVIEENNPEWDDLFETIAS
jgi:putative endonuclease